MTITENQIQTETSRLFKKLQHVGWSESDCAIIAPLTLEINELKKRKNAIILAHSYQTPDIMYGIADELGDSYGLSMKARETDADIIVFCSVHFMTETAKILNPQKEVRIPAIAGCSLAESITPNDIINLRRKHPNAGVVCYVNTTAEVKAECDACCTSANALKVVDGMPQNEIIFAPDKYMAANLQPLTKKKLIPWDGKCIVHEKFSSETVKEIRNRYPHAKILAHTECTPAVIKGVDLSGSTSDMLKYVKDSDSKEFMLITECGLTDRVKSEFKEKTIVGSCALCPYMKKIMLKDVLTCLKSPTPDQIIELPENTLKKAKKSIDKMIEIVEKP